MTKVTFVVGADQGQAAIGNASFDHRVVTVRPAEDLETAIRAEMLQENRGWPPVHIHLHNLPGDAKELNLAPDQDLRIDLGALDPHALDEIARLVDSPDVPDDATIYVVPRDHA